ncbi:TetR/AcrR family transcriptional regulator [Streptomyces litchfieldiae]|uniref:TetR family transcriptional regulator n=1 Tax=Streptomyces litchfieldiae TaxID=3075543 RepID=A0ABU2MM42_9ACTN|nr:TetR family transcriptional regulator [Streptomyces sp. DSM 44938]MDT0341709.1 TetR family transcriptional regulator [Streptomyces sp. DSM 44938]
MSTTASGRPARRRGRPSRAETGDGTPRTRDRILDSARTEFAERGYDKASIRAIARGAEVNPALVHHYFGTKEQVFAAAVAAAAAPATQGLPQDSQFAADEFGVRFTRLFFGIWENPATRIPLLAIVRSAVNNETAARIFRGFVTAQLLSRVTGGLNTPDAELRAELAAAQLVGTVLLRYVLKAEPLASTDAEELIRRLAPVVQHHLTGDAGRALD